MISHLIGGQFEFSSFNWIIQASLSHSWAHVSSVEFIISQPSWPVLSPHVFVRAWATEIALGKLSLTEDKSNLPSCTVDPQPGRPLYVTRLGRRKKSNNSLGPPKGELPNKLGQRWKRKRRRGKRNIVAAVPFPPPPSSGEWLGRRRGRKMASFCQLAIWGNTLRASSSMTF